MLLLAFLSSAIAGQNETLAGPGDNLASVLAPTDASAVRAVVAPVAPVAPVAAAGVRLEGPGLAPIRLHTTPVRPEGGRLALDRITQVMVENQLDIMGCHDARSHPHGRPLVSAIVMYLDDGALTAVDATARWDLEQDVALCLAEAARGWTFLPHETGWLDLRLVCDPGDGLAQGEGEPVP
jgi:hypothetical protein